MMRVCEGEHSCRQEHLIYKRLHGDDFNVFNTMLVDFHLVDSANGLSAFGWHVDDHAEKDQGCAKKYIERSVACQCSAGRTSMVVAGLPEYVYTGVGGLIDFPAWALHRTGLRGSGIMWKLVGFYS